MWCYALYKNKNGELILMSLHRTEQSAKDQIAALSTQRYTKAFFEGLEIKREFIHD